MECEEVSQYRQYWSSDYANNSFDDRYTHYVRDRFFPSSLSRYKLTVRGHHRSQRFCRIHE